MKLLKEEQTLKNVKMKNFEMRKVIT